jgi:hypothetical protein
MVNGRLIMTPMRARAYLRGVILDRFVATLPAMTCGHTSTLSRRVSPEFCSITPPSEIKGRREDRAPAGTRGPLCAKCAGRNCTAADRLSRMQPGLPCAVVGTAYVVFSPGRRALLPPSRSQMTDAVGPGRADASPQDLAPASGARTTRFCRMRRAHVVAHRTTAHGLSRPAFILMPTLLASTAHPARVS